MVKQLFSFLICLTVMLRVWWPNFAQYQDSGPDVEAGSGIVISFIQGGPYTRSFVVRKSNGKILFIPLWLDLKTKWVNVEVEK